MSQSIDSILKETRVFQPSPEFSQTAHIKSLEQYEQLYREAEENPEKFWGEIAGQLHWFRKWDKVLEWEAPWAKWFTGGQINLSFNCLDRHVATWRRNKAAIIWEGEPGEVRTFTYQQLLTEVSKFANVLKSLGIQKGDTVAIYMPMTPELPVAMLACARIGAAHSVVFGGFSADALGGRINDAQAKVLITADGGWRRGAVVPLKANADAALEDTPSIEHVVVARRTSGAQGAPEVEMVAGPDRWWDDLVAGAGSDCPP